MPPNVPTRSPERSIARSETTLRRRLTALAWEALAVVLSAALGVVAVARALAGAKRALLLTDGDSVLLPLMLQSAERHEALQWGMSPVLFLFPELPLYVVSAALTSTVAASLALNGVLNVVGLYALWRFAAAPLAGSRRRAALVALAATALLVAACLVESRAGGNTGEIASLSLTTTYYSGTVMALVASAGLVLRVLRGSRRASLVALTLLAALATLSNPLYLLWVTVPATVALLATVAIAFSGSRSAARADASGRAPARPVRQSLAALAALAVAALAAGTLLGLLGRVPLEHFVIARGDDYFKWSRADESVTFFRQVLRELVARPGGVAEVLAGVLLVGVAVAGFVVVVRRRADPALMGVLFVPLWVLATLVVVPAAIVVTGSTATRYGLPLLFAPLTGAVLLAAAARRTAFSTRARGVVAVAALVLVGLAVPATARVVSLAGRDADPAAACVADWTRGRDVTGAAQFWTGRAVSAYGGPGVRLVQVNPDLSVYPWLVNLASYRNARVSYVLVAHDDYWGDALTALGQPRAMVDCGAVDLYDYSGTSGAPTLADRVGESVAAEAARRGFAW